MYRICLPVLCFLFAGISIAEDKKPVPKVNFEEHVLPIFRQHCLKCHNANDAKGGLAIDSYAALMEGGGSGEIVYDGDAEGSRLYQVMTHEDTPVMPPNQDPLAKEKLDVIKNWIAGGLLENSGSKAKKKKGPSLSFTTMAAGSKPAEIAMPESVWRVPVSKAPRSAAASALATSPWAPLVAIGGQKQVALYNTDSVELVGILPYPEGIPQTIQFSLDGAYLVVAGGTHALQGKAAVYNVKTGERIVTVGNELDSVFGADINDNMSQIALGGPQKLIRIYNIDTGDVAFEMKKHTDWVYCVDYSPDGVLVASGDRSGGLHVWEADTGRLYMDLVGHKKAVRGVTWRADSNVLVSGSEDGTIKVWEMFAGKQLKSFNAHGGGVTSVAMARNGQIVSSGKDGTVKLWQADGKLLQTFPSFGEPALEAALTHDGTKVIGGDWGGRTVMWNAADGKQATNLAANPPSLPEQQSILNTKIAEYQKLAVSAANAHANSEKKAQQASATHSAVTKKLAAAKTALNEANVEKNSRTKQVAALTAQKTPLDAQQKTFQAQVNQLAKIVNDSKSKNQSALELAGTIEKLAAVRSQVKNLSENATKTIVDLANTELDHGVQEKIAVESKLTTENQLKATEAELVALGKTMEAAKKQVAPFDAQLKVAVAEQKKVADQLGALATKIKAANDLVATRNAAVTNLKKQAAAEKDAGKKKAISAKIAPAQAAAKQAVVAQTSAVKQQGTTNGQKAVKDRVVSDLTTKLTQAKQEVNRVQGLLSATTKKRSELTQSRDGLVKQIAEFAGKKAEMQKQIQAAEAMKKNVVNQVAAARKSEAGFVAKEKQLRSALGLESDSLDLVKAFAAKHKQVMDANLPKLQQAQKSHQDVTTKVAGLAKAIADHNAVLAKANKSIQQQNAAIPVVEKQLAASKVYVDKANAGLAAAKQELAKANTKVQRAQLNLKSLGQELVAFKSHAVKLQEQIKAAESAAQAKAVALNSQTVATKNATQVLANRDGELTKLDAAMKELQAKIAGLQKQRAAEQVNLKSQETKLNELKTISDSANEEVESLKSKAEFFQSIYGS